jgi:hypothetical protein
MVLRIDEIGMSSKVAAAGAEGAAVGTALLAGALYASTSALMIRPPGPDPLMSFSGMPFSRAIVLAIGDARIRLTVGSSGSSAGSAAGAAFGVEEGAAAAGAAAGSGAEAGLPPCSVMASSRV